MSEFWWGVFAGVWAGASITVFLRILWDIRQRKRWHQEIRGNAWDISDHDYNHYRIEVDPETGIAKSVCVTKRGPTSEWSQHAYAYPPKVMD